MTYYQPNYIIIITYCRNERYSNRQLHAAAQYLMQRRRKIFEARVLRERQTHGQGVWGRSPPDAEKNFKIEHVRSLEILLL